MNVISDRPITIFRNEYNDKVYYRTGLSKKDMQGNQINGYIDVKFNKGIDLPNNTKIMVENAWIDFWKDDKKITHTFIRINKFFTETEGKGNAKTPTNDEIVQKVFQEKKTDDPFSQFGNSIEQTNDDYLE